MTDDPSERTGRYQAAVREAKSRLSALGWTVDIEPVLDVPGMGRYRPDYIAKSGDQLIIGEVKYRGETSTAALEELSRSLELLPNASLEMVWLGEAPSDVSEAGVIQMARASLIIQEIYGPAALLSAWAALEGALDVHYKRTVNMSDSGRVETARQRLNELASLGDLSVEQLNRLMRASKSRNLIAHGSRADIEKGLVEYVAAIATALAKGTFVTIETMVDWFRDNYKDPSNGVPYDGRDGGYSYFNGGPYDASDVLSDKFDSMPWEDIDDAASAVEDDGGPEWVRRDDY